MADPRSVEDCAALRLGSGLDGDGVVGRQGALGQCPQVAPGLYCLDINSDRAFGDGDEGETLGVAEVELQLRLATQSWLALLIHLELNRCRRHLQVVAQHAPQRPAGGDPALGHVAAQEVRRALALRVRKS